jgi:uncharacterized protein (TIGR00369 family)
MDISEDFEKYWKGLVQFDKHMGMELKVRAPGDLTYTMEIKNQHLTSPDAAHGGVMSAMMDAVLGVTSLSWAVSKGNLCSTVEFKINFLSPVKPGDILEGTGKIDFTGSKLIVTNGQIVEKKSGRLVAKGIGTFSMYPISRKADALTTNEAENE